MKKARNPFLSEAKIVWKSTFDKENKERFSTAQKFVDSECIRLMGRYTPMKTGYLMKSPILGTVIGSGEIVYNAPYARYQYYGVAYGPSFPIFENGEQVGFRSRKGVKKHSLNRPLQYSTAKHPQAQRLWFETMKKKHGQAILRGAAAISGGKVE